MHPVRRATGLFTGILVLQLTLLGAATPCADAAGGQLARSVDHSTHGVAVPADGSDCSEHRDSPATPAGSAVPSCIAMISCVSPMLQLTVQSSLTGNVVASVVIVTPDVEPPTRNTVPEPPPPRA